jgi:hypothetical protein
MNSNATDEVRTHLGWAENQTPLKSRREVVIKADETRVQLVQMLEEIAKLLAKNRELLHYLEVRSAQRGNGIRPWNRPSSN